MSEEKTEQATQPQTEEAQAGKKITIHINGPLDESDDFMINTKESVYSLKQRLETNFRFTSYTNYHFLYKNGDNFYTINSDTVTFDVLEGLTDGSVFYIINDKYDAHSIKQHISHFIGVLTHKTTLIGQLLKYQDDDLPEVLQVLEKKVEEATAKLEKGEEVEKTSFEEVKFTEDQLKHDRELAAAVQKQLLPNNIYFKNFLEVHSLLEKHTGKHEENTFVNRCTLDVWNPPKQSRKLLGDLLYLQVTTKENMILHITGCADGFYVNQSTDSVFNPNISSIYHGVFPTLCALFTVVSPSFRSIFNQRSTIHQNNKVDLEELFSSLSVLPANEEKAKKWFDTDDKKVEPLDFFSEMARFGTIEALSENTKPYVDWEKDYIAVRDIDFDENARICLTLEKENSFTVAVKEGIKAIVDEGASPLSTIDGETPAYIVNGIFFSTVLDKAQYPINRTTTNDEICAVRAINQADVKGLNTLLSCVVDYKGYRFLAQGLIPGLLQKNTNKMLVSGTLDDGRTIYHDERVNKYIEELAKEFSWKKSTLYVQNNDVPLPEEDQNPMASPYATEAIAKTVDEAVEYTGPVDGRIVKGCDDKLYIMDYIRSQPIDILWKQDSFVKLGIEGAVSNRVLRRELVQHWEFRRSVLLAQVEHMKSSIEELKKKEKLTEEETTQLKNYEEQLPKMEKLSTEMPATFDVNAFTIFTKNTEKRNELAKENPDLKTTEDEADVLVLNNFLRTEIIPAFVQQVLDGAIPCEDGDKLTANFHANGINMRYLGYVCDILEELKKKKSLYEYNHLEFLCECEMIARAIKHILIDFLTHPLLSVAPGYVVAAVFNALVSKTKESKEVLIETINKKTKANVYIPSDLAATLESCCVSPAGIWDFLKAKIQDAFHYELHYFADKDGVMNVSDTEKFAVIRRICQLVGITIRASSYNLNNEYPFSPEDIISFHPRVKPAVTPIISIRAQELYQQAEEALANMNFIAAYKIYNAIIINLLSTYGRLHPLVIRCLTSMATILYSLHDYKGAIKYQRLALQCCDRIQGIDSLDSALLHAGLSTYLTKAGAVFEALLHCRLALDSYIVSSGIYSEESIILLMKYAICYRNCGLFDKAIGFFNTVLQHLKKDNVNYALALREYSLTYVAKKDFNNAIKYEKQYNDFYKKRNNEDEKKLIELSNQLLAEYAKQKH